MARVTKETPTSGKKEQQINLLAVPSSLVDRQVRLLPQVLVFN